VRGARGARGDSGPEPGPAAGNQEHGAPSHSRDQSDGTTVIGSSHMGTVRSRTSTAVGFVDADLYDLEDSIDTFNAFLAQQEGADEQGHDAPTPSSHSSSDRAPDPVDDAASQAIRQGPEAFFRWRAAEITRREQEAASGANHPPAPSPADNRAPGSVQASIARFDAIRERREAEIARVREEREAVNAARRSGQEPDGPGPSL
jgi:hypothetical protein